MNQKILHDVIDDASEKRFSFNNDKSKIRAIPTNSLEADPNLTAQKPPKLLYCAVRREHVDQIMQNGLHKKNRTYVHLCSDVESTTRVAKRISDPAILSIDSAKMHKDGFVFYISEENIWLCEHIPQSYIKEVEEE